MTSNSGIPRPFSITDPKRAREEEARRREQATSARNTSSTTIGSGGRLDVVGGDLTISEGGNASVKDGGRFLVEGGGSMEITDDGVVKVVGSTLDPIAGVTAAEAAFQTEEIYHPSAGVTTRSPGLFFKTESANGGAIRSSWGDDVSVDSGMRLVDYGPLVGPDVYKSASARANPGNAGLYAAAFFSTTPDMTDSRSQCYIEAYPDAIVAELGSVALGRMGGIGVSIADPKLRLYGRDGVDVKGPFTVDGAPVGGSVTSVAGKTGVVTLVKADVGLGNVDNTSDANKPVSTATQTALAGKASTAVATPTVNGLLASTDKAKLNAATPNETANALIQRDTSGRAKVADPAVAADIATKGYVDAQIVAAAAIIRYRMVPGTALPSTVTSTWTSMASDVTVPADLFGPGVAYRISIYGQVQANPAASRILSVRAIFNGAVLPGAKVNGPPGPNNGSISVLADYLVSTSQAVTVNCQAQAPFGGVPIGSGDDAPFFTITISPYLAL